MIGNDPCPMGRGWWLDTWYTQDFRTDELYFTVCYYGHSEVSKSYLRFWL